MWKNWLRTDYRAACNWCKNADCEKIVMVQQEDGTHTANAEQVHALIEQTWIPIFKMHELGTRPTWQHFEEVFGDHIPVSCECAVDELDGEKLRAACKKMKSASAPGADGWRVAELQVLPLQLFEKLAQVLNLVEETGTWPVLFTSGLISLIQKGEGSAPQKLRPIGLMASVYRLWASLRVRDIMHGQEKWADTALYGYRPGRRAEDVWMDLAVSVEAALVEGADLVGMSIDWSKCFDRVPQGIAFNLAEKQGLHPRVLQPLRGMYRDLRRRFVMAGHVGSEFAASNGVIQGCPLSVLLLNLLMNTWARAVKAQTATATPKVYADDAGVLSQNSCDIDNALKITGRFATVTQQRLNVDKTKVWGTTETARQSVRDLNLDGGKLDVVNKLKSLGIQLRCARKMTNDVANERIRTGITISRRIRWAPLPLQAKANLIACLVGPIAMYGFLAGGFASKLVNSLRTAVVTALWGTKRRSRCREIVLTLFVKGHLVDPVQNASYQCLRQLRRMAEQRPEAFAELERVWQSYANGGEACDGPVATVYSVLQAMGWHWQAPTLFAREGRPHLSLLDGPESWWLHEIRQGLRLAEWKKAGNRRSDMTGIETTAGIDKLATTKAMNSAMIPPEQRNDLRELLCGCIWTQKRQFDCQSAESPMCLFCGEEPEDEEHMLWRCPRWERLRLEKQAPNDRDRSTWPPCTSRCGIFLEDSEAAAWADEGPSVYPRTLRCDSLPENVLSDERFRMETRNHDYVVAWTDGASVCNQDSRFRRAGCGVFFGINDSRNCSFTLPGREQTNNRAELLAVITAMKIYDGNLEIRSDSDYIVRAANCRMRGEIQRSNLENSDLWKEFDTALSFYDTRQVKFTWVKGHATTVHINRRITTTLDKGGNDAADALASAAAAHHSAPKVLTDAALVRQRTALATHCFASELLFRRRVALLALHEADHG